MTAEPTKTPTPTYDKSYYSWVPGSSLASKTIIENDANSTSNSPLTSQINLNYTAPPPTNSPRPGQLPRRSSNNYQHDVEKYGDKAAEEKKEDEKEDEKVVISGASSKPFQPKMHERTKSWDYQDLKRQMHGKLMTSSNEEEAEKKKEGYTEK